MKLKVQSGFWSYVCVARCIGRCAYNRSVLLAVLHVVIVTQFKYHMH